MNVLRLHVRKKLVKRLFLNRYLLGCKSLFLNGSQALARAGIQVRPCMETVKCIAKCLIALEGIYA